MFAAKKFTLSLIILVVSLSVLLIIFGERARPRTDPNETPRATVIPATAPINTAADAPAKVGRFRVIYLFLGNGHPFTGEALNAILDTTNGELRLLTENATTVREFSRPADAPIGDIGTYDFIDIQNPAGGLLFNTATAAMWRLSLTDEANFGKWEKFAPTK